MRKLLITLLGKSLEGHVLPTSMRFSASVVAATLAAQLVQTVCAKVDVDPKVEEVSILTLTVVPWEEGGKLPSLARPSFSGPLEEEPFPFCKFLTGYMYSS